MGAAVKTQRILANLTGGVLQKYMAQPQSLTGLTPQILAVENLKPAAGGYALVCTVRMPGGAEARQSYFVSAGMEDADELLHELEKLRSLESRLEPRDTRHTGALVVSAAAALLLGRGVRRQPPGGGPAGQCAVFPPAWGWPLRRCAWWYGLPSSAAAASERPLSPAIKGRAGFPLFGEAPARPFFYAFVFAFVFQKGSAGVTS